MCTVLGLPRLGSQNAAKRRAAPAIPDHLLTLKDAVPHKPKLALVGICGL